MMTRLINRLRSDERGAAIIELAIIAPVFALMTVGIVDMSNAFGRKLALEQGAQRAIEKIMQTTGETTVEDTIKAEAVCQVNGVNADSTCKTSPITAADVTVTYRLECTDSAGAITAQTSTDATTFDGYTCGSGTVSEAKYIQVGVVDTYTPLFPIHFAALNGDGTYHLSATAGMRTK
ncbi:MAG TPA: TadE/TadG family type IV pilus assembly protein [Sphingomicrobium sp.]|jgi:Flp pilus assembly protein TadG|nr:TadE/TadG family type IV pilus assembly protein [Sphingomicrobium sp.]